MIAGIGTDIVSVARFKRSMTRSGDRFIERIFRPDEITYCRGKVREAEHFAARFAAKEAVLKAFGTGVAEGLSLKHVEVVRDDAGAPGIRLHEKASKTAELRGIRNVHLSISHCEDFATAFVVLEAG